jgi:signal transduction histidine kinase/CheY-like chemotaxis protein
MRSARYLKRVLIACAIAAAVAPLFIFFLDIKSPLLSPTILAALNLVGWAVVLFMVFENSQRLLRLNVRAKELGVDPRLKASEELLEEVILELRRKFLALSINSLLHKKVESAEELSQALERVVSRGYELLKGTSAELSLYDKSNGLYNTSFLIGRPFRRSAQAMLSESIRDAQGESSLEVIIQPVVFAGEMIGTLRIALERGKIPSNLDREIAYLLASQAAVAIANANYSKQLVRLKSSSDQMNAARTGFLANLSHEIRGPLGIIINASELMLEGITGNVTPEQQKTLGIVQSNGKHLLELINDVLDYSKVESGKLYPKPVEIVLDPFLKEITTIIRSQAVEKGHKLNYKKSEDGLAIRCDKRHLRQMLINLLTNAVKYTPDGGIIDVWAERVTFGKIRISVKDTGIGIAEKDRSKVFAPFERIDDEYANSQIGTGLGMPLTKRLAEVNDGRIDFESKPGVGSVFFIDFDGVEPPAFVDDKSDQKIKIDGKGDSILIVQKDEGERELISKYLARQGFGIANAANKNEALEILGSRQVKLVILDNSVVDGLKENMIEALRKTLKDNITPIVLLSSRAFVSDIRNFIKEGVDRCLIKPVPLAEMAKICRDLIDGRSVATQFDIESEPTNLKKPPVVQADSAIKDIH